MCGVWRVACGALRFIFFGRCLVLQLSPPARRQDGGGSARRRLQAAAAGGGCRRLQAAAGLRLAAGTRHRTPSGCSATKSVQNGSYPLNA